MTVRADIAQKTLELSNALRSRLGELLYQILSEQADQGVSPDMAVSASVSSLINLALKVAIAGGLGPGDFIKSLHLLVAHIERTYGTECKGGVELEMRSSEEIDDEVQALEKKTNTGLN